MKEYLSPKKSKTFKSKPKKIRDLINTVLYILESFGIPVDGTQRRLERMAISFLACGDIKSLADLDNFKTVKDGYALKTREIIEFANLYFRERISSGSYDDIRRKDLKLLTIAGVVVQSSPNSATNDSTRGYVINPNYAELLRDFGSPGWEQKVSKKLSDVDFLSEKLKRQRLINKVNVKLPSGLELSFSSGEHNDLQKAIIEDFLPRYGFGSEILYVGDTSDKYLHLNEKKLNELNFFEISHEELPDVIAYSKSKNWLYLIEAVHSSGAISEIRLMELQRLTGSCSAEIVYVTAFLNRPKFRQFIADIAWETEVWIADNPDHLVHFNGDKFLGPYKKS